MTEVPGALPELNANPGIRLQPLSVSEKQQLQQERDGFARLASKPDLALEEAVQFIDRIRSNEVRQETFNLIAARLETAEGKVQLERIAQDLFYLIQSEITALQTGGQSSASRVHTLAGLLESLAPAIATNPNLSRAFQEFVATFDATGLKAIELAIQEVSAVRQVLGQQFDATAPKDLPVIQSIGEGVDAVNLDENVTVVDGIVRAADEFASAKDLGISAAAQRDAVRDSDAQAQAAKQPNAQTAAEFTRSTEGRLEVFSDKQGLELRKEIGAPEAVVTANLGELLSFVGFGNNQVGIVGMVAQIGSLPIVAALAPPVDFLITRLVQRRNIYKFAIVVDSVASVVQMDTESSIRYVPIGRDLSERVYLEMYESLKDEGYLRIISLHLSPKLSRSYYFAKHAAESVSDVDIKVVNSQTNGLGMGLMIQEIHYAIREHFSPSDIYHLIQDMLRQLHYWSLPFAFNYTRNRRWLDKLPDGNVKVKLKMFNYKPVISIVKGDFNLVDGFYDADRAMLFILHALDEVIKKRGRPRRIGVEYRGIYRQAVTLSNRIKAKYPSISVSTHVAGSVTASYFGPRMIGLCMI